MNLFDLAASVVGGFTLVVMSSLVFVDRMMKREDQIDRVNPDAMRVAIAEKRRILERDRKEWAAALGEKFPLATRTNATREIAKRDQELLALADEEARTPPR